MKILQLIMNTVLHLLKCKLSILPKYKVAKYSGQRSWDIEWTKVFVYTYFTMNMEFFFQSSDV
jgi:hypothetical protein